MGRDKVKLIQKQIIQTGKKQLGKQKTGKFFDK